MIKTIEPHANIELPVIRRALLVYKDWGDPAGYNERWNDLRSYLVYFRANPRTLEYMAALAGELMGRYGQEAEVDMLSDIGLTVDAREQLPAISNLWQYPPQSPSSWSPELRKKLMEGFYDTVIFMVPDAVGLRFKGVERAFEGSKYEHILVMNGRRRFFVLDGDSRRAMAMRRFMAYAWGFEMLLAPFILVVAAVLALFDALTGQSQQKRTI